MNKVDSTRLELNTKSNRIEFSRVQSNLCLCLNGGESLVCKRGMRISIIFVLCSSLFKPDCVAQQKSDDLPGALSEVVSY